MILNLRNIVKPARKLAGFSLGLSWV